MNLYSWAGNIRELQHTIERAVILCESNELAPSDLALKVERHSSIDTKSESLNLELMEKQFIEEAIRKYSGNLSKASKDLGLTRQALYRRMEKYEL